MEILHNLLSGIAIAFQPYNFLYCLLGIISGVIIGALPGVGATTGVAILLPMTFGRNPVSGIILLSGIYYGSMYGGSISSMLINTPGTPSAVVTGFDGYPLAQQGKAGLAMGISAISSFAGTTIGLIGLVFLSPLLAKLCLKFGPPEYFSLMFFSLIALSMTTGSSSAKGFTSTLIGLFISMVGLDFVLGMPRFDFGIREMYSGLNFIAIVMGIFGIAEILNTIDQKIEVVAKKEDVIFSKIFPTIQDWIKIRWTVLRSSVLGFIVGVLPGAGATIASFMTYGISKNLSKEPEKFGKGAIEGIASSESANNAACMGAFIPLFSLGVPGSATIAVIMGAIMMFGLRPGPSLIVEQAELFWGLMGSMFIGNLLLVLFCIFLIPLFVKIIKIPRHILSAYIIAIIFAGAYSINNSMFNVYVAIVSGIIGYFMKKINIPLAPMTLSIILGGIIEGNLRRSLMMSHGNMNIFFIRPISAFFMILTIIILLYPIIKTLFRSNSIVKK